MLEAPPLSLCTPEVLLIFCGINLAEKALSWPQIQQPVSGAPGGFITFQGAAGWAVKKRH